MILLRPRRRAIQATRFFLYAVALAVFILDQLSKLIVLRLVPDGVSRPLWGLYLSLTVHQNTGAAFGLFASGGLALTVLAAAVALLIAAFGPRLAAGNTAMAVGLGLSLGGAVGNLLDRLRLGHVVDFLDVHFWPVFNGADIAITCGAILVLIGLLVHRRQCSLPPVDHPGECG